MTRSVLDEAYIHPAIREIIAQHHAEIVREVQTAIAANSVVVVGMAQNPFPQKACRALDAQGIAYKYLEYGSYFNKLAPSQRAQDVDRVAYLSDGVRHGRAGGRRERPRPPGRERGTGGDAFGATRLEMSVLYPAIANRRSRRT